MIFILYYVTRFLHFSNAYFSADGEDLFISPMKFLRPNQDLQLRPFKCGQTVNIRDEDTPTMNMVVRRRKEYGEAIRKKVQRPKTAEEYIGMFCII